MADKKLRIAAADVGSNNLHLTIAEVERGELQVLTKHEIPTRLSQDVDDDGRVSPDKMIQVASVLSLFKALGESYGVDKFLCVATEATRSANNAEQFLQMIRDRADVDVQVISGETEAALTFRGATYNRKLHVGQLVVDIGGGSTELIAANRHHVDWIMKLPIGSGRMNDRFIKSDPPTRDELDELRRYLAAEVFSRVNPPARIRDVIFTGGTAQELHHLMARNPSRWKLERDDLKEALKRLRKQPTTEIARLYQMDLSHAQVLPAGIAIAQSILNRFDLQRLRISPQGVRSGLILSYAEFGDDWNKHLVSPDVVRAPSPPDHESES